MTLSEILNLILGGGIIALVISVATLRASVRKANADAQRAQAEAKKAEAEAETVRIDNAEHATRVLIENIVKPLKNEFNETKTELAATKKELARNTREMARLRKALDGANGCDHRDVCPVLDKLRDNPSDPRDESRERRECVDTPRLPLGGGVAGDGGSGVGEPADADTAD